MMASVIQWNLQSYFTKFTQLKLLLQKYSPTCVCLQETRHNGRIINPPSQYNILTSTAVRNDGHERGVALLIHKSVNYQSIPLRTTLQAVAAKIYLDRQYTVCSLYLPHIDVSLNEVTQLLNQLSPPFILAGDMNAKSPIWGEIDTNNRGKLFENLLNNNLISILNDGSPTHYHLQTNTYSTIDLSICSSDLLPSINYKINDSLCDSDHYPIILTLNNDRCTTFDRPQRFDTSRANWKIFEQATTTEVKSIDYVDVNDFSNKLENIIISAANLAIPKTSDRMQKPSVPWWNHNCHIAVKRRNQAERALKRNYNVENMIRYKRAKAYCRYICNNSKKESWKSYISSMNKTTDLHQIWKRVQKISGKYKTTPTPILIDDATKELITDHASVADKLASSFASVSGDHNYCPEFIRKKNLHESRPLNFRTAINVPYNNIITFDELRHAMKTTSESSPGKDLITYSMIKSAHKSFLMLLLELYNRIFMNNEFPESWKIAIVIPIPKPDKDHRNPLNYRPISLTSCMCKVLERIINDRIMWYLEKNQYINIKQSGFRKHRSTTDHLIDIETALRKSIDQKQHTIIVFFDLQKAYDTASKHIILQELYNSGMRGNLPQFISNFLSHRKIIVRVGNTLSRPHALPGGIPQGSVLSCTCFLLAINTIINDIPIGIGTTLYVDDLAIYASSSMSSLAERRLQLALNRLYAWSQRTGLNFSTSKTVGMHICRKHNCPKIVNSLMFNGVPILTEEHKKFLGLFFDNSLTWRYHITELKKACHKILDLFKHLTFKRWGADRQTILRLYIMLMKPKIDYGCEAYSSACRTLLQSLYPLQNSAMRIATGAFKSSPIPSLLADTSLLPLKSSNQIKMLNYASHILINPNHPHYDTCSQAVQLGNEDTVLPSKSFFERLSNIVQTYDIDMTNIMGEPIPHYPMCSKTLPTICKSLWLYTKKEHSDDEFRHIFYKHVEEHEDCLQLYTDGSRSQTGVGYAVIFNDTVISDKLPTEASSFTAELTAIYRAIVYIVTIEQMHRNITIFSDSRSAIESIDQLNPTNPLVETIQNYIMEHQLKVTLCWVPSHVGIRGNERADKAARLASERDGIPNSLITRQDFRNNVKIIMKDTCQRQWSNTCGNKLRDIKSTIAAIPNTCFSNRHWERTLCRLRIGHCSLTHGFLMSGDNPPYCNDCIVPLTVRHLLVECPSYGDIRRDIFGNKTPSLKDILTTYADYQGRLYNYLIQIDIINKI